MIIPIDTAVVVELEKIEEQTKGGIYLTQDRVERDQMSITEGVLVALGDSAYSELKERQYKFPQVGEKVCFKRFSGILRSDKATGKEYRIMQDIDVYSVITEEVANG